MLDRNGYAPSIFPEWTGEVRHEIYFGKNRKISKRNGFWLLLSVAEHQYLHGKDGHGFDSELKRMCQKRFEKTHTREEFIRLIGKSYL